MTRPDAQTGSILRSTPPATDMFAAGGEMAALMRTKSWQKTPLGQPDSWPQSLRSIIRIMLTSRFAMWMGWGPDLTFFYNNAYIPTLGIKHDWALGQPAHEVWREIWPDIGPRIDHVLRTGEATWDEALLLFLERSGYAEETYHTFSYSPLADDHGATVGILCVVTEETERVISQRRIACLSGLASAVAGTNTRREVLDAASSQLGANPADLPFTLTYLFDDTGTANLACTTGVGTGHPVAPLAIDPDHPDAASWPVAELLARRATVTVANLARQFGPIPAGAWDKPPREAVVVPIPRPGHDSLAGFLVAALNPYRPADPSALGFLDLIAGQLAAGLANADAYQQERRRAEALAEIDNAKTAFFANISHEFRTPLTLILGSLEEFLSAPVHNDPKAERTLVETAHRNAMRLLKLVNNLLDFARTEASRVVASFQPADLAELTADLASGFRSAFDKSGVKLLVDCPKLPQPVHVDRDMWERIVLNLLSNAFKFTFEGEVRVTLRATQAAAELFVSDTGTGIPTADLPRLFERFHRVAGARGRTFEGSGIGLALVQELVRLHGGSVTVDSTEGQGSRFTVSLPFGTDHLPAGQITADAAARTGGSEARAYIDEAMRWLPDAENRVTDDRDAPPSGAQPGRNAAPSVLIADDNADMRDYLRRLLTEQGYDVHAVADGEAALAELRRRPPDLVLSDVMMPNLDGFGLLRATRADPALTQVPVVLLSARAGQEARVEGLQQGADDYLTKPFSAGELLARVGSTLQMARLRRDAADLLRARTAELEAVLATVPAAVWFTTGTDATRIYGNPRANALLRIAEGANATLSAPPAERPDYRVFRDGVEAPPSSMTLQRALRGEQVQDDELEIRFPDGTSVFLLTYATPLRDTKGCVIGGVCTGIDITASKRQETRFHQMIEAAPSGMVMADPAGRIVMVNTQTEQMFGYARNELLGQPVEILVPERFRQAHPGLRTAFFSKPESRPMGAGRDLNGRRSDGTEFPIEIGLNPIETDEGPMVLSAIADISERVSAARALAASEAEFRASFENAAIGKLLATPQLRCILRANDAFAGMLGCTPNDLIGRNCADLVWHKDKAKDAAGYARLLSGEDRTSVQEKRYVRRDGSPFWVRVTATIARPEGSADRAIVVIAIEDIDTRYKAETALRAAKLELEQVVEERSQALAQRDLLLREVYHRVKNNLQLVDSLLMMQSRKINDKQASQALHALRERIFTLGLVHQQLMASADLKTFDVVPFLDELSRNIMAGGGTGGVTVDVRACTLEVGLDFAVPLGLLVTELLTNSLKHAFPDGVGTISVTLRPEPEPEPAGRNGTGQAARGDALVLIVSDNGIGMPVGDNSAKLSGGVGTRLIGNLVAQLEGDMTVRVQNGTTTEIRLAMPAAP